MSRCPSSRNRLFDGLFAETAVGNVARYQDTILPFRLDGLLGLLRIIMLVEIDDRDVSAFARIEHGDRPADAAIAAGDEGDLALELLGPLVAGSLIHGSGPHFALKPWLGVMLRLELGRIFARAGLHGLGLFLAVVGGPGFERRQSRAESFGPALQ